jgi:hypothetical protein
MTAKTPPILFRFGHRREVTVVLMAFLSLELAPAWRRVRALLPPSRDRSPVAVAGES